MGAVFSPKAVFTALMVLIMALLGLRMLAAPRVIISDGLAYYAHLRSAVIDGNLNYDNEFRDFNPMGHLVPNPDRQTPTGYVHNKYPIGSALLWLPFFLIAHLLTLLGNLLGVALAPDGYSLLYQIAIAVASLCYGGLAMVLMYRFTCRFYPPMAAALAIALFVLASNVIYYLICEPAMSHVNSMFTVALFMVVWHRDLGCKSVRSYMVLGLVSGLMILVRYQNGLFMLLPLMEMLQRTFGDGFRWRRIREALAGGLSYVAVIGLVCLPQLLVWKIIYGQYLLYTYSGEGFDFQNPHLLAVLFSSRHGLFTWTPVAAVAAAGVVMLCRHHPRIGVYLVPALILQWGINAAWQCWWFGDSFSSRAFVNCTFIFVLGLTAVIDGGLRRGLTTALLLPGGALIAWNMLFIAQWSYGLVPHQEAVDWSAMIPQQLGVLRIMLEHLADAF